MRPPKSRVREATAIALLVSYTIFVLVVVFWPTPIDQEYRSAISKVLGVLHRNGVPEWFGYNKLEFTANVGMFIPLGFLIALAVPAKGWWLAPVISILFSTAIEFTQGALLAGRFATPQDVLANSIGGIIGALLAVVLRALVYHRDTLVVRRALWDRDEAVKAARAGSSRA